MIKFFQQELTAEMKEAASFALENEAFILGESVSKFEEEFAKYIGTKFAVSVNSGTSALYLSLMALGIKSESKVLTSTNSFVASANCILMANAKPILCDINSSDGNLDITSRDQDPDYLIPVHIYGNPCNFDEIIRIKEERKIPIIEDACQAHGATFNGQKVGSIGDVGCFSFYPTKNMTVGGDGGMITTNDETIVDTIKSMRHNGRNSKGEHDKIGFTMRLNTVNAAIGRIQLRELDNYNERRSIIAKKYREKIGKEFFLEENKKGKSVYHQIVMKHKKRNQIIKHLADNDIGTAIHYALPIHKQPLYSSFNYVLPNSEKFASEILSLPSYPSITDENIKIICEKINEIL